MSGDYKAFVTSCWERGGMIICYFPSRENLDISTFFCEQGIGVFFSSEYSCFVWTVMEETGVGCLMLNS